MINAIFQFCVQILLAAANILFFASPAPAPLAGVASWCLRVEVL
jgi:hypothetical protein